MKYIKAMKAAEFAELLLEMRTGEVINFATESDAEYADESSVTDVNSWYFAKKFYLPEFDSRFILIDYCTGEEAFAIPMNRDSDNADDTDRLFLPVYVNEFFDKCLNILNRDSYIYVELEE